MRPIAGRCAVGVLVAISFVANAPAQDPTLAPYGGMPYGYGPQYAGPGYATSGGSFVGPDTGPGVIDGGYSYQPTCPHGCPYPGCQHASGIATRELPRDRGWGYEDTPLDRLLKNAASGSWLRLEYLFYEVKRPGGATLGAPVNGVADITEPFDVFVSGTAIGQAQVVDLSSLDLNSINGVRGTIGVPLIGGDFEANFWGLAQEAEQIYHGPTGGPVTLRPDAGVLPSPVPPADGMFIATSTYVNGAIGDNLLLYDQSFRATLTTQTWGTEANFILDRGQPGEGFRMQPILGFRYLNMEEQLNQAGVFNSFGTLPDLTSQIKSHANNNLFGPQVGLRSILEHRAFDLSVDTMIMLGANNYQADVTTITLRSAVDPTIFTKSSDTELAAIASLGVNFRAKLNESVSITVGYNLIWADGVVRPFDSIYYNDNGASAPADVVSRPNISNMYWRGLSVGGQITLP